MVNGYILPQNALQHDDNCIVNFWLGTKNSANWCVQQSWECLAKWLIKYFKRYIFLLKLAYFFVKKKVLSENLEK